MSTNQETINEIRELLISGEIDASSLVYGTRTEFEDSYGFTVDNILDENDGDGNEQRAVLKICTKDRTFFVRLLGTYSSWDSSEWYPKSLQEVREAKVTTTAWIAVDGSDDDNYLSVD